MHPNESKNTGSGGILPPDIISEHFARITDLQKQFVPLEILRFGTNLKIGAGGVGRRASGKRDFHLFIVPKRHGSLISNFQTVLLTHSY